MKRLFVLLVAACAGAFLLTSEPTRVTGQSGINTSKWYQITNQRSGKCLDMQYGNHVAGAYLIQYTCHSGDNQKFQFQSVSDGYYRIVAGNSLMCVDQFGANQNNGGLIGQYYCHSGTNQQWLPSYDSGWYQFNVRHSGKNMDVNQGSYANGAQLIQYIPFGTDNQLFSLTEVDPPCTGVGGDADQDSYCANVDCDDNDPDTYPGAPIYCESGYDRNCNSVDDEVECYASTR